LQRKIDGIEKILVLGDDGVLFIARFKFKIDGRNSQNASQRSAFQNYHVLFDLGYVQVLLGGGSGSFF
jgi:hypothetical protein